MKRLTVSTCITLALGLGLTLALLWLLVSGIPVTQAQGPDGYSTYYVAPSCTGVPDPCFTTVQAAVDAADDPDDVVKVAGSTYTDVYARPRNDVEANGVVTQVVYISKTITIQGGYTTTNWSMAYPIIQPTTLDAQEQGRVLYITGHISPTIEGLRITGGDAVGLGGIQGPRKDAGGGVYIITATVTMSNSGVFSNTAGIGYGGGLCILNSSGVLLSNNTITGNGPGSGGGLCFWGSPAATLTSNSIAGNGGGQHGGGLYFKDSPGVTLIANSISGNDAAASGGGLHLEDSSDAMLITNTITDNRALSGAGLSLLGSPDATLTSNRIMSNRTSSGLDQFGGGLICRDSNNVALTDNDIHDNFARHGGGGLFLDCNNMKLTANTITDNDSANGGGLRVESSAYVELAGNMISGNTANRGAGINFIDSDNVTLSGNAVTSNRSDKPHLHTEGGGLRFEGCTNMNLINNVVTNNSIDTFGGGLLVDNSDITLTNNVIADNQADVLGSGLYITRCSLCLLHTTIARNHGGDGSGVYITGTVGISSDVTLTNTILVSHTVGITVAAVNTATLNGVLWYSNTINYGGEGTIIITNPYTGDPAFAADGYHLTRASAAIDKDVDTGVNDDIDGDNRPFDGDGDGVAKFDIGADEFVRLIYLPLVFKNH